MAVTVGGGKDRNQRPTAAVIGQLDPAGPAGVSPPVESADSADSVANDVPQPQLCTACGLANLRPAP